MNVQRCLPVIIATVSLASCERPAESPPASNPAASVPDTHTSNDAYVRAAETIVAFLRGETTFDAIATADSVMLMVSPEGGGATVRIPRDSLRTPAAWRISTPAGARYALVPPTAATQLTTAANRHINCRETSLETIARQFARMPHVGTKLEPPGAGSCLQAWNVTFVFSPDEVTPTLVAAVYDQWEW